MSNIWWWICYRRNETAPWRSVIARVPHDLTNYVGILIPSQKSNDVGKVNVHRPDKVLVSSCFKQAG